MSVHMPKKFGVSIMAETSLSAVDQEILAEKATSLGNAGRKVENCLEKLRSHHGDSETRMALVKRTADAVYAYFVQRELCGFRRHDDIIRDYGIPREVLVRLGAR
ncbi:DUF6665 family protein [Mesorhizobium sp. WSM2239]|jgi:hypothetical protein|uniref:DUF6665 family protein n=2 Tax=unclassified Mesorhizobium TaxID=325217 RepID=A0AAU8DCP5_9HYPH